MENYTKADVHVKTRIIDEGFFAAVTLLAITVYFWEFRYFHEQIDDAYISFQYAKNLIAGHGLVFNIGERVEGFTNLLWTLLIAAGMSLGYSAEQFCWGLSLFSSGALLFFSAIVARVYFQRGNKWIASFVAIFILSSNSFVFWTVSGLEQALFSVFVTACFVCFLKSRSYLMLVSGILATLSRPEGVLFYLGLAFFNLIMPFLQRGRGRYKIADSAIMAPIFYFVFLVCYEFWRVRYYGEWLPNTFYAKAGGIPVARGLEYFFNFVKDGYGLLVVPILVSVLRDKRGLALWGVILAYLSYTIAVGGDVFDFSRFYLPILPIMIIQALHGCSVAFKQSRAMGIIIFAFLPATSITDLYFNNPGYNPSGKKLDHFPYSAKRVAAHDTTFFGSYEIRKRSVEKIMKDSPQVHTIAAISIGQTSFYSSGIRVIDLVGLADAHIARSKKQVEGPVMMVPGHQRTDSDYVLRQNPGYICITKIEETIFMLPAIYDLSLNEDFKRNYAWDEGTHCYKRKDL